MLTVTFLTALAGAIENWFYERFFASELYAAGHPLARGVFALAFSFPYILVGLVLLGLPADYALRRLRLDGPFPFAVTGAATGVIWGLILLPYVTAYGYFNTAFYGCVCALFWWLLRPSFGGAADISR